MFAGHIGERAVALDRRRKPVRAFEICTDHPVQWINGGEPDSNTEASLRVGIAGKIVTVADFHSAR